MDKQSDSRRPIDVTMATLSLVSFAASAVAWTAAWLHWQSLNPFAAEICGHAAPHCGWCYPAAGFVALGVVAGLAATCRLPALPFPAKD